MDHARMRPPLVHHAGHAAWSWALLGSALGLLLALMLGAPARWLSAAVGWATEGRVLLQDERGTVWSGSASLTLAGGTGSQAQRSLPGRVAWRWGLAWPGVSLELSADCCTPRPLQWRLRASGGAVQLHLQDQQSEWPMELLAGLGAPWNTLQAQGRLRWHSQDLQLRWQDRLLHWHGQTELQAQQLSSALSTLRPMGSYRVVLQGAAGGTATPDITLVTVQGPLRLQGQGQWLGQRLRFRGEASADEGFEPALSNLLNIVGRRDGPRSLLSMG